MRNTFIKTLTRAATRNPDLMLLTADLGFTVFEQFQAQFPGQFINVGVAEQNLVAIASGLALSGKTVVIYSIVPFLVLRSFEQIKIDIAAHNLPVVVVGVGAGLAYSEAGITHHAVEDIALVRTLPRVTVFSPASPLEVAWATKTAISLKKPVYLRLGKKGEPEIYPKTPRFQIGKGVIVRRGRDIAIVATGAIVAEVLGAAVILKRRKIIPTVVSMHTLKPLDVRLLKRLNKEHRLLVTVEEHSTIGGLGSAVAEILVGEPSHGKLVRLGIPDRFIFEIGSHAYLRKHVGLDKETIATRIRKELR